MLSIVLQSWKTSLSTFLPQKIKFGIVNAIKISCNTLKSVTQTLHWLLALDIFLTIIIAEAMAKQIRSGTGFTFLCFLMELNWFIIYGSIITFTRKKDDLINAKTYLKTMLFRYVQALFIFTILFFFLLCTTLILNFTKFPNLHWAFVISFQILELLIIFYWLDSNFKLIDFFASMEKAVNLVFYNFPVFIIFFGLLLGLDFLLRSVFSGTLNTSTPILLNKNSIESIKPLFGQFAQFKFIFIKYSKILLEIFWICILYTFYDRKRNMRYNENIFDHHNNYENY